MTNIAISRLLLIFLLALAACTPASIEEHTPTPAEITHIYSYFSAYAFLDANRNGQPDSSDAPSENATFIITLPGGTEFGGQTDDTGYAFISIPAGVEYPVMLRMEAPKDSALKAIEPSTITLSDATAETIQFLFSSR